MSCGVRCSRTLSRITEKRILGQVFVYLMNIGHGFLSLLVLQFQVSDVALGHFLLTLDLVRLEIGHALSIIDEQTFIQMLGRRRDIRLRFDVIS